MREYENAPAVSIRPTGNIRLRFYDGSEYDLPWEVAMDLGEWLRLMAAMSRDRATIPIDAKPPTVPPPYKY